MLKTRLVRALLMVLSLVALMSAASPAGPATAGICSNTGWRSTGTTYVGNLYYTEWHKTQQDSFRTISRQFRTTGGGYVYTREFSDCRTQKGYGVSIASNDRICSGAGGQPCNYNGTWTVRNTVISTTAGPQVIDRLYFYTTSRPYTYV